NVDREHLDYYGTYDRVLAAFVEFANRVPFYGAVVVCLDDPDLAGLIPQMTRRVITYGLESADAMLTARDITSGDGHTRCSLFRQHAHDASPEALGELCLSVPGRHNLSNALAAVAVGLELELPFPT